MPGYRPCAALKLHSSAEDVALFSCTAVDRFAPHEYYKTSIVFIYDSYTLLLFIAFERWQEAMFIVSQNICCSYWYLHTSSPPPLKICLKRMFTFISGYFVHLFLHLKISYHLNHISGNHHPAQILSLEEVGGFFFRIMLPVSKKPEAWHISSSACLQFTQTTPRQQV